MYWGILSHFQTYSELCVTPMSIISTYNHAFFWTLEHLEPEASLTSCRTCKMIRHIQVSPAFLKVEKVPWFWREKKDCVHLLVKLYIQEHLRKKTLQSVSLWCIFFSWKINEKFLDVRLHSGIILFSKRLSR